MGEKTTLAVTMTREDWLTVYGWLRPAGDVSPVAGRLREAIDRAIDAHTDAILAATDVPGKGE